MDGQRVEVWPDLRRCSDTVTWLRSLGTEGAGAPRGVHAIPSRSLPTAGSADFIAVKHNKSFPCFDLHAGSSPAAFTNSQTQLR